MMTFRSLRHRSRRARAVLLITAAVAASSAASAYALTQAVPSSSDPPSITGSAVVGEELTASDGAWQGAPTSFSYQWRRCNSAGAACADVVNATARSYGVRTADVGNRLRVVITATNTDGKSSATSDA